MATNIKLVENVIYFEYEGLSYVTEKIADPYLVEIKNNIVENLLLEQLANEFSRPDIIAKDSEGNVKVSKYIIPQIGIIQITKEVYDFGILSREELVNRIKKLETIVKIYKENMRCEDDCYGSVMRLKDPALINDPEIIKLSRDWIFDFEGKTNLNNFQTPEGYKMSYLELIGDISWQNPSKNLSIENIDIGFPRASINIRSLFKNVSDLDIIHAMGIDLYDKTWK